MSLIGARHWCQSVIAVLAVAASANAEGGIPMEPMGDPAKAALGNLMSAASAAGAGVPNGLPGSATVASVPVYQFTATPDGPNYLGYGWVDYTWTVNPTTGVLTLSFNPGIALASDFAKIDPKDLAKVVKVIATLLHELGHVKIGVYHAGQCKKQAESGGGSPQQKNEAMTACTEAIKALDACIASHCASKQNDLDDSFCEYMAFLCLCKKACDQPEGSEAREKLMTEAITCLAAADTMWDSGQAALADCDTDGPPPPDYPLPPLDPEGPHDENGAPTGDNKYSGPPEDSSGAPVGCDCDHQSEDTDPCADAVTGTGASQ